VAWNSGSFKVVSNSWTRASAVRIAASIPSNSRCSLKVSFRGRAGLGALAGSLSTLIATGINIIQPQRKLIRGTLQVAGVASFLGSIFLLFRLILELYIYDPFNMLFMFFAAVLNGTVLGLVARFTPLRFRVLPYILIGSGFGFLFNFNLDLFSYDITLALVGGLIGLMVGLIGEQIQIAESLRWSWSLRWSLLGLICLIIISVLLIGSVLGDQGRYTADNETHFTKTYIVPEQAAVDNLQAELNPLRTQWATYNTSIPKFDQIQSFITSLVINQNQRRVFSHGADYGNIPPKIPWDDLSYYTARLYQANGYSVSGYEFPLTTGIPTFAAMPPLHTDAIQQLGQTGDIGAAQQKQLDNDLADINAQLRIYSLTASQLSDLTTLRYSIMRREDIIKTLQRDIALVRRDQTQDGYNDRLAGAIRVSLVLGLSLILAGGVVGGLRKTEVIEIRTRPNSGMRRTFPTEGVSK